MACDHPGHELRIPGRCPGSCRLAYETDPRLTPVEAPAQAPIEIPPPVPAHEILWAFGVQVVSGAEVNIAVSRLEGGNLTAGLTWIDPPSRRDLDDVCATLAVEVFKARGVSDE